MRSEIFSRNLLRKMFAFHHLFSSLFTCTPPPTNTANQPHINSAFRVLAFFFNFANRKVFEPMRESLNKNLIFSKLWSFFFASLFVQTRALVNNWNGKEREEVKKKAFSNNLRIYLHWHLTVIYLLSPLKKNFSLFHRRR